MLFVSCRMAAGADESWWGWLQSAKEKVVSQSTEVLEFVKNDIDEFTKVVSEEASTVVSATASALKTRLKLDDEESTANHMKKSVSGFLTHVAEVFTPPPDDEDEEAFVISNQQPVMLSRLEAAVYTQVQDPKTFLQEPVDEADYNKFLESFDMESKQVEMADLLVSCRSLHKNFFTLVPTQVSHTLFWHRYFYLVHQLQQREARRKEISSRAADATAGGNEEELLWEDDEVLGGDADIPEDLQTQLLQQYEEELMGTTASDAGEEVAATAADTDSDGRAGSAVSDGTDRKATVSEVANSEVSSTVDLDRPTPKTKQPKSIKTPDVGSASPADIGKFSSAKGKTSPAKAATATQLMRSVAAQKQLSAASKTNRTAKTSTSTASSSSTSLSSMTTTKDNPRKLHSANHPYASRGSGARKQRSAVPASAAVAPLAAARAGQRRKPLLPVTGQPQRRCTAVGGAGAHVSLAEEIGDATGKNYSSAVPRCLVQNSEVRSVVLSDCARATVDVDDGVSVGITSSCDIGLPSSSSSSTNTSNSSMLVLEDDLDVDDGRDDTFGRHAFYEYCNRLQSSGRPSLTSGDSNEDEWEKVDATDSSGGTSPAAAGAGTTAPAAGAGEGAEAKPNGEDWETWE